MLDPTTGHGATDDSTGTSGDNANTEDNGSRQLRLLRSSRMASTRFTAISGSEDYSISRHARQPQPDRP